MFSFQDYRKIVSIIKSTGRDMGYREAMGKDRFVIMRRKGKEVILISVYHACKLDVFPQDILGGAMHGKGVHLKAEHLA